MGLGGWNIYRRLPKKVPACIGPIASYQINYLFWLLAKNFIIKMYVFEKWLPNFFVKFCKFSLISASQSWHLCLDFSSLQTLWTPSLAENLLHIINILQILISCFSFSLIFMFGKIGCVGMLIWAIHTGSLGRKNTKIKCTLCMQQCKLPCLYK